jgi:hypothetical protein
VMQPSNRSGCSWTRPRVAVLAAALSIWTCASAAAGQPTGVAADAQRVEIWGALSTSFADASGTLASSYSPPLLFDGEFTSAGRQTVTFDGRSVWGFEGGVNLFLVRRRAGLQLLFHRASTDVAGSNSPYDITLQYTSQPPPTNEPIVVNVHQAMPWPDSTGTLTRSQVAVNGVIRVGQGRMTGTLSGGLSSYALSGDVQPLAFTTFRLGGHSVLFQDDYRLAVSLEPIRAIGFNVGGDLDIAVGAHVALMIGYRVDGGPATDMPVRVTTVLNANEVSLQQTVAEIVQRLAPGPARVSLSGSRAVVGLKWMP